MRRVTLSAIAVAAVLFTASAGYALWSIADKGTWPDSWPEELEPLRKQSRSLVHTSATVYEIPFTDREQFEAAWLHILSQKSPKAPIVLYRGPHQFAGVSMAAGVRIRHPNQGTLIAASGSVYPPGAEASVPGGTFAKVGPPWPEAVRNADGSLPEYVILEEGKWRQYREEDSKGAIAQRVTIRRARAEIELIVDGDVVDLNRIRLPENTPIIDRRFPEESDTGKSEQQ
ncbi:hypothetical protein Mal4_00360 [Maioricimonas rarisocia]|uniref:Uncharacterized protein n=1 Tax=Maioricimonas rarisocia TaxID=2528026 RepID=A0A517YZU4_9PLAN|nr:hypothetical protein [Maioricimonas rarisocia]QDU35754.1 hypothetical protein Mal4_00360 [Maioricimonas rarisocia]